LFSLFSLFDPAAPSFLHKSIFYLNKIFFHFVLLYFMETYAGYHTLRENGSYYLGTPSCIFKYRDNEMKLGATY